MASIEHRAPVGAVVQWVRRLAYSYSATDLVVEVKESYLGSPLPDSPSPCPLPRGEGFGRCRRSTNPMGVAVTARERPA